MPDPTPPRSTAVTCLCWAVILGVVGLIMVGHVRHDRRAQASAPTRDDGSGPAFDVLMAGRAAVALANRPGATDALRRQLTDTLDRMATRPVDRLAVAIVTRELAGPAAALKCLPDPDPRLKSDAAALSAVYAADSPSVLSDPQRADLLRDLGWFGRLAVTQGEPDDAPARAAVLAQAQRTSTALTVAGALAAFTLFLGFAGLVTLVVLFAVGALRFAYVPPAVGPTVWLETFAVWLAAFVLFSLVAGRLPIHLPILGSEAVVAAGTAAIAFGWPMWRAGLSVADVRRALGWHVGRGLFTEMACGVAGYVAGLPVLAAGLVVTLVLTQLAGAHPSHPIEQEFGEQMSGGHVLSLFATAAVLAPILEETMFRGALFGHLRRRHRAWVSAGIVAFLFAAIHPQGWTTIPVLGSIALILAFLREWRGSLIASMTAHAINNGVLVAVVVMAVR
jgi:membrane protease YdiL (CAAX protease family)